MFDGSSWRLAVPDGVIGRVVEPGPEYESLAVFRGWISDYAPVTVVVSTRSRRDRTLRKEMRLLSEHFISEGAGEGQEVHVKGAHGARRMDGLYEIEEGVSDDGIERVSVVIAARSKEFVYLVARSRPGDAVEEQINEMIVSLALAE